LGSDPKNTFATEAPESKKVDPHSTLIVNISNSPSVRVVDDESDAISRSAVGNRKKTIQLDSTKLPQSGRRKAVVTVHVTRKATVILELEQPSRDFIYLGLFFASLQVLDGVLTSVGVARYGIQKEANPVLRRLMEHFSPEQTLFLVKAGAIFVIVYLTVLARKIKWVKDLIGVLSCIYLFAAILPWIYILYVRHAFY
jgi:hypothetical protein